jgi:hypothetical protein
MIMMTPLQMQNDGSEQEEAIYLASSNISRPKGQVTLL